MAITQALTTSFKTEILTGIHAFGTSVVRAGTGADTFKLALYTSATMDATTTAYTTTDEITDGDYTAGGENVTISQAPTSTGTTAWLDFADTTWSSVTLSAEGAMLYNSTAAGNNSVFLLDFGASYAATSGDFTVQWPAGDASTGIIRIA